MRRALGLALLALASAAAVAAADRPLVGPAPDWVQPAGPETDPAPSSDAAVLVLLNDTQVRFSPTEVETYSDSRVRIQTPQGLGALGTLAFSWQPDNDAITVHRIAVRRGDAVRDLLGNGEGFTILRREDLLELATLTGMLTAIIQPPDLQVGDVVELSYTHRHADPVVPDAPARDFAWLNAPVQEARFRAVWPRQMPLRWQPRDFKPELTESTEGTNRSIAFTLKNPQPLLQPVGAPARYAALRRLELTSFQSWAEVSRRLAPLYVKASALRSNSPLHAEVERIRKAHADPKDRAAAALRLAQEQVRYVALAMNEGALVPASADETWERRYGDCKAKTALLLALLRELGVDAEPVAVHTLIGDGVDRHLPGVGAFDHILVRATIAGRAYWLDGTRLGDRQLDRVQTPALGWGLPLTARGSELVKMEPAPLAKAEVERDLDIDVTGGVDEAVRFSVRALFRGDSAQQVKLSHDNLEATQREEAMRAFWRSQLDRAQVDRVGTRFDEGSGELHWTAEGTIRLDWTDDFYEIPDMRLGYRADFSRPGGADANAPYELSFPEYWINRVSVKLPSQTGTFTISGEDIDRSFSGMEFKRQASIENALFRAQSSYRTIQPEFPASEAPAAETALRELFRNGLYLKRPVSGQVARAPADDSAARSAKAEIARLILEGKYDEALRLAEPLSLESPKDLYYYSERASALRGLGRLDEARKVAQQAVDADVETVETDEQVAAAIVAFALAGATDQARILLDREIAKAPTAILYRTRAMIQPNPTLARADFEKAIELDPQDAEAITTLASLHVAMRNFPEARKHMDRLESLPASTSREHQNRAAILVRLGETARAESAYAAARAMTSTSLEFNNLCWAQATTGVGLEAALKDCDTALAEQPDCMPCHDSRGLVLLRLGRFDEAIASYDKALEQRPDSAVSLFGRGLAKLRSGRTAEGETDINEAIRKDARIEARFFSYGITR